MAATITVRYYTDEQHTNLQGYPLRVVAVNAIDMPKEIFVFVRHVDSTDPQADKQDEFVKVAEPNALDEYPVQPPNPVAENPYYRKSEVSLVFRSYAELQETKDLIDSCIRGLVGALRAAETLDEMEEVTYDE